MFLFVILFFLQSFFGAESLLTPTELYKQGYGLPSCPTIQGINQIVFKDYTTKKNSNTTCFKKKWERPSPNWQKCRITDFYQATNITNITNIYQSNQHKRTRNDSSSSSDDDKKEKKKKNRDDNSKALLATAVVVGTIGVGAYVWDFWKHSKHEVKGCDYQLDENGQMANGVWYETHQASRWTASTLVTWPDFYMGQKPIQVNFSQLYSQGIISVDNKSFIYGRDFSSVYSLISEKFYMKEIDIDGNCLRSVPLPCKPKKIVHLNGTFYMLSYDGYLYYKAENPDFTRLYIKNSENDFF